MDASGMVQVTPTAMLATTFLIFLLMGVIFIQVIQLQFTESERDRLRRRLDRLRSEELQPASTNPSPEEERAHQRRRR